MATLVFSAIGTLVGGPLGGAVGALVGRQVDAAIIGSPNREGPRLKELTATTSSYGSAIPRHFGRMRVPGSIIWSTELEEHSERQGGGKVRPSVTSYTYTASFAVALSSRPILDIGRIWADGNLLRGDAGDLKVGGQMRIYDGYGDQLPDPLIAEIEGADRCPAYRRMAYVVFEDLELEEFFNRIPALTFEVIADQTFSLQDIVGEIVEDAMAQVPLDGVEGFSNEGTLADTLQLLDPIFPIGADSGGELLTIARDSTNLTPIPLTEPAISVGDGEFGGVSGFARSRLPLREDPPQILRYYDVERDYLPGMQRSIGRPPPGEPRTIELPAALTAGNARSLIERTNKRADWSRDRIAWRTTELDPAAVPGAEVLLPGKPGRWRVNSWEWREQGIEFALQRIVPACAGEVLALPVDPGRINPPLDLLPPPSSLVAFELPWDGSSSEAPATYAAVSSSGPNWRGAALYADQGDGELIPLGPSGRTRSIIGETIDILPPANPLLIDRQSSVIVRLLGDEMALPVATSRQLALGANKALLGTEIIQFGHAIPLGDRLWRIEALLRGRGGTEPAVAEHQIGEQFVLLDLRPLPLDSTQIGSVDGTLIVASGRGDIDPVTSAIALAGITQRPLSPVHPRMQTLIDGTLSLSWTRRARGAWLWLDGVDTPLHEQQESYLVTYGPVANPVAAWTLETPLLTLSPQLQSDLAAALPGGNFRVRQNGNYAQSEALLLATL